jgi:hypothetical protein
MRGVARSATALFDAAPFAKATRTRAAADSVEPIPPLIRQMLGPFQFLQW